MPSPDEIRTWRDALIQARLSGVREVRDADGKTIRYATDSEMAAAIRSADKMLAGASRQAPSFKRITTSSKRIDR
ncbi:hypothetical protein BA190_03870 [Labrys sp. WJW]|uniref:phage head-tail joining protein n=1 Tax=Labrys sp. WJW TaxID=1737983 RepID=UPI0008305AA8|nr:hypothetical protein [Labrys sp. WJW]OCC06376.1 hypothetical protein BA190_03870 [Labrys sp. WJW]